MKISTNLMSVSKTFLTSDYDINIAMNNFNKWIENILNLYFPIKCKYMSIKRLKMPWINRNVLTLINKEHKLFIQFKKQNIPYTLFKAYSQLLKVLIYKLKVSFTRRKFEQVGSDSKMLWHSINDVLGRSRKKHANEFISAHRAVIDNAKSVAW